MMLVSGDVSLFQEVLFWHCTLLYVVQYNPTIHFETFENLHKSPSVSMFQNQISDTYAGGQDSKNDGICELAVTHQGETPHSLRNLVDLKYPFQWL